MLRLVHMPKRDGDLTCLYVDGKCEGSEEGEELLLGEDGEEEGQGEEEEEEDVPKQKRSKKEKVKGVHSLQVGMCFPYNHTTVHVPSCLLPITITIIPPPQYHKEHFSRAWLALLRLPVSDGGFTLTFTPPFPSPCAPHA